jgi:hypothetical protein
MHLKYVIFSDDDDAPASSVELRRLGDSAPTRREIPAAVDFLTRVPRLTVPAAELTLQPLDHRSGFLVSLVDGRSTVETILDLCAMPSDEALQILQGLIERGVVIY